MTDNILELIYRAEYFDILVIGLCNLSYNFDCEVKHLTYERVRLTRHC